MMELIMIVGYILRHVEQILPEDRKTLHFNSTTPDGYVKKTLTIHTGTVPYDLTLDWLDYIVKGVHEDIREWLKENRGRDVRINLAFDSAEIVHNTGVDMDHVIVKLTYFEKI